MPLPVPEPGLVLSYSSLWHSEYEQDQEEGLKDRPCAVILVAEDAAGETLVTVVPIAHRSRGAARANRERWFRSPVASGPPYPNLPTDRSRP